MLHLAKMFVTHGSLKAKAKANQRRYKLLEVLLVAIHQRSILVRQIKLKLIEPERMLQLAGRFHKAVVMHLMRHKLLEIADDPLPLGATFMEKSILRVTKYLVLHRTILDEFLQTKEFHRKLGEETKCVDWRILILSHIMRFILAFR